MNIWRESIYISHFVLLLIIYNTIQKVSIGLLAMWMEASVICYLAFIFPMVTAPVIVHQRRKLNKFPSLQEENNMLRLSVNDLSLQNDQLETLNTKVEAQVSRLGDAENTLKTIAEEQGTDLTQLSALVSENGRLLRDMRALQESHIMGEVMTAIISSDHSRDFHIDKNEMAILLMRLRMCDGINHVDEEELRSRFRASKTNSIQTIVDITKSLMQEDQLQIVRNAETEQTQIV
jgi:hypothetical protein